MRFLCVQSEVNFFPGWCWYVNYEVTVALVWQFHWLKNGGFIQSTCVAVLQSTSRSRGSLPVQPWCPCSLHGSHSQDAWLCGEANSHLFVCDPVAEMAIFLLSSVRPGFLSYLYFVGNQGIDFFLKKAELSKYKPTISYVNRTHRTERKTELLYCKWNSRQLNYCLNKAWKKQKSCNDLCFRFCNWVTYPSSTYKKYCLKCSFVI